MLDLGNETLSDGEGRMVTLRPKAWAVLRLLSLNAGRLVTKQELLDAVWPKLVVTDDSLAQAISDVRAALGDTAHGLIKTVPRRGYRLVLEPRSDAPAGTAPPQSMDMPAPIDRPSIAVLAFADPRGDADGMALARGFAYDIVAELARNADLRVVSHHSSFALDGSALPMAQIGQRLRSRYIVDGSVQRIGETLVVNVELLDSDEDRVAWSARHEAQCADLLSVRDALVHRIGGAVHAKARYAELSRLGARPPKVLDVYALTMRSLAFYWEYRAEAVAPARALLEQALAIDAEYAPAWAWLALLTANDAGLRIEGSQVRALALDSEAQARRAIALDRDHPVAWRALSFSQVLLRGFDAALATMQRSVEIAPSNADSLQALAAVELWCGRTDAALATIERALDLHPLPPPWITFTHGAVLWSVGRLQEALRAIDASLAELPSGWTRALHICALAELGRIDDAREEALKVLAELPGLTAERLALRWSDSAAPLRERILRAAVAAGIPRGSPAALR